MPGRRLTKKVRHMNVIEIVMLAIISIVTLISIAALIAAWKDIKKVFEKEEVETLDLKEYEEMTTGRRI